VSTAKSIVSTLAPVVPVGLAHSFAGAPLVLPYYHMVSDEILPHVAPLYSYRNIRQFTADVDFFLKHFQPVNLSEVLAHVRNQTHLPRHAFFLTFDDGFREVAEVVAPILKAKGVPAAFFVNSAFVDNRELCMHQKRALLVSRLLPAHAEKLKQFLRQKDIADADITAMLESVPYAKRAIFDEAAALFGLDYAGFLTQQKPYLSSDQIRGLLRDGFAIGGHSVDHPFYGHLTLEEQLRQTRDSVEFVCKTFGVRIRSFAFPHSDTGVSRAFFERSYANGTLEISFGTGGLLRDAWPGHFQRYSMEKVSRSPWQILAWQLARALNGRIVPRANMPSGPAAASSIR